MADATRLPSGILINADLTTPRPVGTIVENNGGLYRSTDAAVATYVGVTAVGDIALDNGETLTAGNGLTTQVQLTADSLGAIWTSPGGGTGAVRWDDTVLIVRDPASPTKAMRFDVGLVTAGQTRVLTMSDDDQSLATAVSTRGIADPGDGLPIPVEESGHVNIAVGAGAETNNLGNPLVIGQELTLTAISHGGGSRAVTAAGALNNLGNTVMTFADVRDSIFLKAINVGGNLRWDIIANNGVALS